MLLKTSHITRLLCVMFAVLLLTACKKNDAPRPEFPDFETKVNINLNGVVLDENNNVVQGATVKAGNQTTVTDDYGLFSFTNVQVVKNAAVVTVTHSGYFPGIRTFIAEAGKPAEVRIKLLPKTVIGTIDAAAGGTATDANGLSVALPPNGVKTAAGADYNGTVTVVARWINPASDDISLTMPGDLRALNTSGELRTLLTYGMAAVELLGNGGELLQVADGKTSTLTMPLPASLQSGAPSTIPLWHFDEEKGLWIEDGFATKNGDRYVGEVSHYSFWNCDLPQQYVQLNLTLVDTGGIPVPYARVKLTMTNSPFTATNGYTNAQGYVSGAVPANTDLVMEVYTGLSCGLPVYTQNVAGSGSNILLGTITLPATQTAHISGTLTDCSMMPVTNGQVIITIGGIPQRYAVDNSGAFSFSMPLCANNTLVTLVGEDMNAMQQSMPITHTLVAGSNSLGNIQACGVTTSEFFTFTVDGSHYSYTAPVDSIFMSGNGTNNQFIVGASRMPTGGWIYLTVDNNGIGVGSTQQVHAVYTSHINDSTLLLTPPNLVTITEYGNVGEFITGNFNLILTGAPPTNRVYNLNGQFRVRRSW